MSGPCLAGQDRLFAFCAIDVDPDNSKSLQPLARNLAGRKEQFMVNRDSVFRRMRSWPWSGVP